MDDNANTARMVGEVKVCCDRSKFDSKKRFKRTPERTDRQPVQGKADDRRRTLNAKVTVKKCQQASAEISERKGYYEKEPKDDGSFFLTPRPFWNVSRRESPRKN